MRIARARAQRARRRTPYQEWRSPGGGPWLRFYRADAGYLLRFPGLADYELAGAALAVTCRPAPGISLDTCEHLYRNQVLPLVLSKTGKLVFHASAVTVDGVAAAFLGESGRGKSTLAASFAAGGHRFLADDGLVVEAAGAGFAALPSHPSIRLWEDSRRALLAAPAAAQAPGQTPRKARFPAGRDLAFCRQPRPLRRAYFLGDGQASAIRFERMGAAEALIAWVRNSFLLDPAEPSALAAHFCKVAALTDRVGCYRLDYPRRFGALARLRAAIAGHLLEEALPA